jgi:hypothetical protein
MIEALISVIVFTIIAVIMQIGLCALYVLYYKLKPRK